MLDACFWVLAAGYWSIKTRVSVFRCQVSGRSQSGGCPGRFWSRAAQALAPRVEYWNLSFVCYLVLGICTFRHKNPSQSHLSLTHDTRDRVGSEDPVFNGE